MQICTIPPEQFDHCEADRVRTARRSRGEDAVRLIVDRRNSKQIESIGTIEFPQDEDVRKTFDVRESRLKFGKNFKHSVGVVLRA